MKRYLEKIPCNLWPCKVILRRSGGSKFKKNPFGANQGLASGKKKHQKTAAYDPSDKYFSFPSLMYPISPIYAILYIICDVK